MIHLDTSFLIRALHPGTPQDATLRTWLAQGKRLVMCSVAWAEYRCGPLTASELDVATAMIGHQREFTATDSEVTAKLFNKSGRRRGSLVDCMIAAAAIADDAPLATANPGDFDRFRALGLKTARVQ